MFGSGLPVVASGSAVVAGETGVYRGLYAMPN
jgi:hypothetical protein